MTGDDQLAAALAIVNDDRPLAHGSGRVADAAKVIAADHQRLLAENAQLRHDLEVWKDTVRAVADRVAEMRRAYS